MSTRIQTTGEGYEEVTDGEDRVYLHRLTAVSEFGFDAVSDMDVHHMEIFEGRSIPFLNVPEWLEPMDPETHRMSHLNLEPETSTVSAD